MDIIGYKSTDYNLDILYRYFLKLEDKKEHLFDYDLEALAFINAQSEESEHFKLKTFHLKSEFNTDSIALVTLKRGTEFVSQNTISNGSIDAIYNAIYKIINF